MFVGRERELSLLQERYDGGAFEFLPVYGRRRVGKTSLLRKFVEGKESVFYTATKDTAKVNLDRLAAKVFGHDGVSASLTAILSELNRRAESGRLVLVIDEYPNLVKKSPGIADELQTFIDDVHETSKLFIILCGSSLSVMEHQVLGYKSPLYGRRTGSLKLEPLDLWDSMLMLKGFAREDALRIYGMVGGIPLYLSRFDPRKTLVRNVADEFLRQDSFFANEHTLTLIEELDTPDTFYPILSSISGGSTRNSDIAAESGIDPGTCSAHLKTLMRIGIVERVRPVDNPNGRTSVYAISDPFIRFQFGRVLPVRDEADDDGAEEVAEEILREFDGDMGRVFEGMCGQWMRARYGGAVGRWWGTDPSSADKRVEEIDAVLTRKRNGRRIGIFAECKYRNEPQGTDVLETLRRRAALVRGYDERRLMIFSKGGFTEALRNEGGAELHTLDDVLLRPVRVRERAPVRTINRKGGGERGIWIRSWTPSGRWPAR